MPLWRVGQAFVLLELYAMELEQATRKANLPESSPTRKRLRLASQLSAEVLQISDMSEWIEAFRNAMVDWLTRTATRSAYQAERLKVYSAFVASLKTAAENNKVRPEA